MALSILAKEQENFLRYAILIVDHSKEALQDLVELDLKNKHLTFEEFLNQNQHEIYHLCYDSRCCQCQNTPPRRKRIIFPSQLELLFDKFKKSTSHRGTRHNDFCCSSAKVGITTQVLDLSLARCVLVNCCLDVFWFTCLTAQGQTLEQFLNCNKHIIYHLWKNNQNCCQCPPGFIFPCDSPIIDEDEWRGMYSSVLLPCINDRKRTSTGTTSVCSVAAKPGIDVTDIHPEIQGRILKYCCSVRNCVEKLIECRHMNFGHVTNAKLSDDNFNDFSIKTEKCILYIASFCAKEQAVKDVIKHLHFRPIDARLCSHYQNILLENIDRNETINENIISEHIKTRNEMSFKLMKLENEVQDLRIQLIDRSRRSQHIRETLAEIENHRTDKTYTLIKAVSACVQKLENSKVIILSGREGSGKSKNSLEILRQVKEKHPETDVIKLRRLSEFMDIIDRDKMTIVLFEDIFGRVSKQFCENSDVQILDSLHLYINLGNVRVIFVMRNTVKHECQSLFTSHDIFCNSIDYLDLNSEEYRLSLKEKESIFINYCTKNEIDIIHREDVSSSETNGISIDEIKVSIIDKPDFSCRLSADNKCIVFDSCEVEDMIRSDPYQGFPQCCRLFTQNKNLTMLGAHFFKYPLKSLLQEIESMRMEGLDNNVKGLKYVILVYILLNQAPSVMSIDANSMYTTLYKLDKRVMVPINENQIDVQAHQKLFNECYNKICGLKLHDIMYLYEELTCRYLTRKEKKTYFQHQALQDSVLISYCKVNPQAIIPLLSIDHMIDIVRPQNYMEQEEEIVLKISKTYYAELANKIISLMNDIRHNQSKQLSRFMESKIITDNDVDLIYELIGCIKNQTDTSSSCFLLSLVSYTHHYFPLYLLRNIGKLDKKMLIVNHTKGRMFITVSIADKIISLGVDPDISLPYAFQSKYKDIIEWLLKNTDHSLLDFRYCFTDVMPERWLEYTKLLFQYVKHDIIDMTQLFINVSCICDNDNEYEHVIDWIVDNVDNSLIDYDECIHKIIGLGNLEMFIDLILYIVKKTSHVCLDINTIVYMSCQSGSTDVIVKVLQSVDPELFEKDELINTMVPDIDDDEDCWNKIVQLILPWMKYGDFNRFVEKADNYRWYGVLESLIVHVTDLSVDIVKLIEKIFKWWDDDEVELEYDYHHIEIVFRLLLKHHIDNIDVAEMIMDKACHVGSHCVVEELLLDKFDNISYYLNITLDNCLSRRFDEISVSNGGGYGKLLMLFIQRVDNQFIDLNSLMSDVCNIGHLSAALWLLENKHSHCFDLRNIMNKASYHGDRELVEYLKQNYKAGDFDYKTAMIKACRNWQKKTLDVCKWLWGNIGRDLFDMKVALNNASRCDNYEVVEWILTDVDKGLLDIESAVLCASEHGNDHTLELLLDKSSINMIDFEHAITLACKNKKSGFKIIKLLYRRADKSTVDMNVILSVACKNYRSDIVQWMIETCDQHIIVTETSDGNKNCINSLEKHLLDINLAMNCIVDMDPPELPTEEVDATKNNLLCIILKKSHLRTIDLNKLLTESCKKDWLEIFICLLGKVDNSFLNIRGAINVACQCGALNIVKWSLQNIDVKLLAIENVMVESCAYGWIECLVLIQKRCYQYAFNLQQSMVEACTYGRLEIVEWLLQNVNYECFHLPLLLQEAGRNGWMNIFSSLVNTFEFRASDLHVATNEALANGHLKIVEWMVSVLGRECLDISSLSTNKYLDSGNEAVVKFILRHFDPKVLDIAAVFTNACKFGWKDTTSFIVDNDLSSMCDLSLAFNQACDNGEIEIVKLLLEKVEHQILNVNKALLSVAVKGWDEIAILLLDNVEHTRLDIGNAFFEACRHGEIDVVQVILRRAENNLLDVNTALSKACENHMHEKLVLWILENIDQKQVDLKTVKKQAIRHKWRKVQFAIPEVDTEDLNEAEQGFETDCIVIS